MLTSPQPHTSICFPPETQNNPLYPPLTFPTEYNPLFVYPPLTLENPIYIYIYLLNPILSHIFPQNLEVLSQLQGLHIGVGLWRQTGKHPGLLSQSKIGVTSRLLGLIACNYIIKIKQLFREAVPKASEKEAGK